MTPQPVPYFGGKGRIAPQIAAALPPHRHYVECFGGSLAVLLAKPTSVQETANDVDQALVTFWRVLRDRPEDLARACALTPHSRAERLLARDLDSEDLCEVERARRVWVALAQGRTSTLANTGWRHDVGPASTAMPHRLRRYVARMEEVSARLRHVSLEARPAPEVITSYGRHADTLIYADPPYLSSLRGGSYRREMGGVREHEALAEALRGCRASVVLSGYDGELYRRLYDGWHSVGIDASTSQGGAGSQRVETLWSNREFRYGRPVDGGVGNESHLACGACGRVFRRARTGRPPRFCSTACRVAAHRGRSPAAYATARTPVPVELSPPRAFTDPALTRRAFFADERSLVLHDDALAGLKTLLDAGLRADAIVTSPPFYGQRDYGCPGQIGLEGHPQRYLDRLAEVFAVCRDVLADGGSLWINVGDTYWAGRGQSRSGEAKQPARKFGLRPQDRAGDGAWARPKSRLLLPHRLAVGLQESGWLVRGDNIWVKPAPVPDQVSDRCSLAHEHVLHLVKSRNYYFDRNAVGQAQPSGAVLPPPDVWTLPTSAGNGRHRAAFPEALVRVPVLSTCPPGGVLLDPFAGTGTSLVFARRHGRRCVGIDLDERSCAESVAGLRRVAKRGARAVG